MRKEIIYFDKGGPQNTAETIAATVRRASELGIRHIVCASTTGETALSLREAAAARDVAVVCVSYHAGFHGGDEVMPPERQAELRAKGIQIVICTHALSGVERSLKNQFGAIGPVELMAYAFRRFGDGVKVAIEISAMAADAGAVPTSEDIISLGGTGKGADSAIVVKAAHQNNFFELRVREIIAMARGA